MGRVQDKATIGKWILQAKGGSQDAFSMLVETYYPPIFRLVFQMVPHRQDAEDILQEAFFRFFQAIRRVDPEQDPFPFLKTIAVRRTYSFLSSHRHRPIPLDDLPEDLPELAVLGHSLEIQTLYSWAQALPPAQRLVFLLREVLGVGDTEIARMTGIREVTVRRHASLARQALERRFG
jgi:RNA polymerase sigma-70 factor (ECF subfamily)